MLPGSELSGAGDGRMATGRRAVPNAGRATLQINQSVVLDELLLQFSLGPGGEGGNAVHE